MKIKTSEVSDVALNWLVASYCEYKGRRNSASQEKGVIVYCPAPGVGAFVFAPDRDWAQGGPIAEREWDAICQVADRWAREGVAHAQRPLLAHWMRCVVASRLGDEVDVPDELLGHEMRQVPRHRG